VPTRRSAYQLKSQDFISKIPILLIFIEMYVENIIGSCCKIKIQPMPVNKLT